MVGEPQPVHPVGDTALIVAVKPGRAGGIVAPDDLPVFVVVVGVRVAFRPGDFDPTQDIVAAVKRGVAQRVGGGDDFARAVVGVNDVGIAARVDDRLQPARGCPARSGKRL
jgi:hypothetical protein